MMTKIETFIKYIYYGKKHEDYNWENDEDIFIPNIRDN